MSDHIIYKFIIFVLKLSNDTALATPDERLSQSLITCILKKCLGVLYLTNVFFILNLYPLVIEVRPTSKDAFSGRSSPWIIFQT